jgi:hypothetical protein
MNFGFSTRLSGGLLLTLVMFANAAAEIVDPDGCESRSR